MRPLLVHLNMLKIELIKLDHTQLVLFSTLCCERGFLAYKRSSLNIDRSGDEIIRLCLDKVWDWLEGACGVPVFNFENILPEEAFDSSSATAIDVVDALSCLSRLLGGSDKNESLYISELCLNIVDGLAYDNVDLPVNSTNDLAIDEHELIKKEISRQTRDFYEIKNDITGPVFIKRLKNRAVEDITLGYWFEDSQ
ncbi:YjaG family protein [Iodobacter sp. HSC-16F04]|uniref:YjaG family protein n=1 Tax=Iodobacter violaceini TaxID=3044271 RepID=A0ABX0KNX8_9NEIS|nr:DUF416 family protein [Iodobacter violacea]NHQ85209.1 YjaG family protein [Iodobacter violacea]